MRLLLSITKIHGGRIESPGTCPLNDGSCSGRPCDDVDGVPIMIRLGSVRLVADNTIADKAMDSESLFSGKHVVRVNENGKAKAVGSLNG